MYFLKHNAFISGTIESGLSYNIKKQPYEDFWRQQESIEGGLFITEPCPVFPFDETVWVSRGFYDFAHIPSTSNSMFVSERTLEVFSKLNMPPFQIWPIKYMVRKKLYEGFWIAFYHDYGLDIDCTRSVFKLTHSNNNSEDYIKVKDIIEYKNYFNNYIKCANKNEDFVKIEPVQIKFLPHVYELDLITIFHFYKIYIASVKFKALYEEYKIKSYHFIDGPNFGTLKFI